MRVDINLIWLLKGLIYGKSKRKNRPNAKQCASKLGITPKYLSKMLNPNDPDNAHFRAKDIEIIYKLYKNHGGKEIIEYFASLSNSIIIKRPPIRATKITLAPELIKLATTHAKAVETIYSFLGASGNETRDNALTAIRENIKTSAKIMKALELWREGELPFGEKQ